MFNVFYNEDIFKEAGVEAVPETWEQFLDACEKIKAAGYIPITSDDAYILCNFGYHLARYIGSDGVSKVVKEGCGLKNPR